ncbi:MAG TPA: hydroxymethylbilane synthase [Chitinophagales bacterium]|nr:hydroxymethylbilane synthase [Chitinophagales bacterium]
MKRKLRIATRSSPLAVLQARSVEEKLKSAGVKTELVFIKSKGDLSQKKPVYSIATAGVFTKAIDDAVLKKQADIGVHSLKDLPTVIHPKLMLAAVLKREKPQDVIIFRTRDFTKRKNYRAVVATGSVRRKAQWLHKYPHHIIVPVRGNVDARLKKLKENHWDGMILALAGLKRLQAKVNYKKLDWMIPAPGQGAIAVVCRKDDPETARTLRSISHKKTFAAITAERAFLSRIGAGCSTPAGACARIEGKKIFLRTEVLSLDGKQRVAAELSDSLDKAAALGRKAAEAAFRKGARKLLKKKGP